MVGNGESTRLRWCLQLHRPRARGVRPNIDVGISPSDDEPMWLRVSNTADEWENGRDIT
jgi:hypothetical protein